MFIFYGNVAFNLANSTKIEKEDDRIIVWYSPIGKNDSANCEIYDFSTEEECSAAWYAMKMQIHEFNKKN